MTQRTTVDVVAGHKGSGEPVYEELLVEDLGGGEFRLAASPGLVLGTAAGDRFRVSAEGRVQVLTRGGNLAVQYYAPHEVADTLLPEVERLGGSLDARAPGLTTFTLPVSATFGAVEGIFYQAVAAHPGTEWYFGNVYAEDGVTPLLWWEPDSAE